MKRTYLLSVFYFTLFGLLLMGSGAWILFDKTGFSIEGVMIYYGGDEHSGIPPKSLYGQLEVVVPHLGAMGLFVMVVFHFLLFVPKPRWNRAILTSVIAFAAAALSIGSGLFISSGYTAFAYVKLAALLTFYTGMLCVIVLLVYESARTLHHARAL